jgi:hypothetical protein
MSFIKVIGEKIFVNKSALESVNSKTIKPAKYGRLLEAVSKNLHAGKITIKEANDECRKLDKLYLGRSTVK